MQVLFNQVAFNSFMDPPRTAELAWIEARQSIHREAAYRLSGIGRENL
jgi:hypothetical protein